MDNYQLIKFKNYQLNKDRKFDLIRKMQHNKLHVQYKEKATISDGLFSVAPLFNERCNYNAMIDYLTIRKLKEGFLQVCRKFISQFAFSKNRNI